MALVQWSEDLTVGVAVVDADHRKLFDLVNYLYDSMVAGKSKPEIEDFINSLIIYTKQHFSREEAFFEETGYPDRAAHKREHDELLAQILHARDDFKTGTPAKASLEMIGFVNKWMIGHIKSSDLRYAPHLHASGIS
jgi:hemerythrin-like metal-binding protein